MIGIPISKVWQIEKEMSLESIKKRIVKELIESDVRTDFVLTLNTCSQMKFEKLNSYLSLLSAITNKIFISGKWWKKIDKRIRFNCFNEKSVNGHTHTNCLLSVPNFYSLQDVLKAIRNNWLYIGRHKNFVNVPNQFNGNYDCKKLKPLKFEFNYQPYSFGELENYISYQVKEYEDDYRYGFDSQYSKFNNNRFNIW